MEPVLTARIDMSMLLRCISTLILCMLVVVSLLRFIITEVTCNAGRLCAMRWLKLRQLWTRKWLIWHGYERKRLSVVL